MLRHVGRQREGGGTPGDKLGAMSAAFMSVTAFRNLCRSSPWRWQSLRFELHHTGLATPAVHCWVRRPGALRVEAPDGTLLAGTTGINASKGCLYISGSRKPWLLPPALVNPIKDDDGYVVRRPEALYGEPAYGTGRASAALDPVELSGEHPVPLETPFANPADVSAIAAVSHYGRDAVEAILTPGSSYRPVFADAPLLFPGRTKVRIDLETGVCVAATSLEGPNQGAGHWMVLLAVNEYMPDELFESGIDLPSPGRGGSWS